MNKTHEDYVKEREERVAKDKAAFDGLSDDQQTVSYTHLTLPTIYSV